MKSIRQYAALAVGLAIAICASGGAFAGTTTKAASARANQSGKLDTILKRIQIHYQKTDSLTARFNEDIAAANGMKRARAGKVYYRKPGKMRWEFTGTEAETIVSDGKDIYSYQPDLNQVMKAPLARVFKSSAPAAFLLGVGDIKRDFKASIPEPPPSDDLVHVALSPKGGGETIELGLDPQSYNLTWLRITDQLGNVSTLRFSDIQSNIALNDAIFAFVPPKDADIVEAPGIP